MAFVQLLWIGEKKKKKKKAGRKPTVMNSLTAEHGTVVQYISSPEPNRNSHIAKSQYSTWYFTCKITKSEWRWQVPNFFSVLGLFFLFLCTNGILRLQHFSLPCLVGIHTVSRGMYSGVLSFPQPSQKIQICNFKLNEVYLICVSVDTHKGDKAMKVSILHSYGITEIRTQTLQTFEMEVLYTSYTGHASQRDSEVCENVPSVHKGIHSNWRAQFFKTYQKKKKKSTNTFRKMRESCTLQ